MEGRARIGYTPKQKVERWKCGQCVADIAGCRFVSLSGSHAYWLTEVPKYRSIVAAREVTRTHSVIYSLRRIDSTSAVR